MLPVPEQAHAASARLEDVHRRHREILLQDDQLAAQPPQAVQETNRAINLHLQAAISLVAPFALSAEAESFATEDIRHTIETFKKKA